MADSDAEEFYDCDEVEGTGQQNGCRIPMASNGKSTKDEEKSIWGGRTRLPVEMFSRNDYSLWSILKQCIGKELSKITMPLVFNEPLSFLQRIAEYMEYISLIEQACSSEDPIKRHELVTAFAVSVTASNWERLGKPFNPLLGETFEFVREDFGYRMVCEQVSHHPPVSAFHLESAEYVIHGSIHPKLKFWGKSVEVTPKGITTLYIKKYDEAYSWQNVNCCVHNVIIGKIWIEHYGDMEVFNHKTGWKSVLNFHPCGWFGKDLHRVDGYLQDEKKNKLRCFCGKWIEGLYSFKPSEWNEYLRQVSANQKNLSKNGNSHNDCSEVENTENSHLQPGSTINKAHSAPFISDGAPEVPDDAPIKQVDKCQFRLEGLATIWKTIPKPPHANKYYSFTYFAMLLNEPTENMHLLPPTDCRLRPDIRNMEEGFLDDASWQKNRLEEKQRAVRKERKKNKEEAQPLWFKWSLNKFTGKEDWIFDDDYWKRDWSRCPDIF